MLVRFKKTKSLIILAAFLISMDLFSGIEMKELPQNQSTKKHQLSICAIFKDEACFLKEWIEYHRLVGVDHFYLYNNESSDDFLKILQPYVHEGIVSLTNWPDRLRSEWGDAPFMWVLTTQVAAYE